MFVIMYSRDEKKQLKHDFWNGFADYCGTIPVLARRKSVFMLYNTRMKGVELKFDVRRDGADVVLEVNGHGRREVYSKIAAYRVLFEEEFASLKPVAFEGCTFSPVIYNQDYERESGEVVGRIYVTVSGIDFHRREHWPAFYEFMATRMIAMERVFKDVRDACSESV